MTLTGTEVRYTMTASASVGGVHTSGGTTIGTTSTAVTYATAPDIAYSLGMQIAVGETLTYNTATGEITGSDAGVAQVETATVVAAAGATSNGDLPVTITGAAITGSPVTVQVALTTATHTTAALIAAAIRTALNADDAISAEYTASGSGADVVLTKAGIPIANDSTLEIAWTATLGVSAMTNSTETTTGVMATMAYRLTDSDGDPIAWDQKDHEGRALPAATKLYSVLMSGTFSGADLTVAGANETGTTYEDRVLDLSVDSTGAHKWTGDTIDFTAADANLSLTLDIHAGT